MITTGIPEAGHCKVKLLNIHARRKEVAKNHTLTTDDILFANVGEGIICTGILESIYLERYIDLLTEHGKRKQLFHGVTHVIIH